MGAPQARLFETALGLQKRGWEVEVIAAMPNYPTGKIFKDYKGHFSSTEEVKGIKVNRYILYSSNAKKSLPRIISMLSFSFTSLFAGRKLKKFNPSYIITESPPLTVGLSGLILAKMTGAKHILNVSDIWPLSAYELGAISKGFLYSRLEGLERFLYKKSFACTGQSLEIVEQLKKTGSQRVHLYRNGVDYNRFESIRTAIKTKVNDDKIRVVYAGLLGLAQGILGICENIDFVALNAEFHIYGEGAEKVEIQKYLKNNQSRGIFLHESVKRDDVPKTIMQYNVTLIPLIKPIFGAIPSKVYEAMAAGLPIIFTGGGEGARLIEQYKIGWVSDPSDYEAIKQKVLEIVTMDIVEFETIKQNCIDAAKNIFNREIQIEKLDQFLTSNI